MVESGLSNELIDAGSGLLDHLSRRGVRPEAAFWLYSAEADGWKLVLAEPNVGKTGPRDVYRQIQATLTDAAEELEPLELDHITLTRPDASIVELLRSVIRVGSGKSGIRIKNNVVNGVLIEDAYVYRIS